MLNFVLESGEIEERNSVVDSDNESNSEKKEAKNKGKNNNHLFLAFCANCVTDSYIDGCCSDVCLLYFSDVQFIN